MSNQCVSRVSDGDWGHSHQCRNNGNVEFRGKWYCGVHDPAKSIRADALRTLNQDLAQTERRLQHNYAKAGAQYCDPNIGVDDKLVEAIHRQKREIIVLKDKLENQA